MVVTALTIIRLLPPHGHLRVKLTTTVHYRAKGVLARETNEPRKLWQTRRRRKTLTWLVELVNMGMFLRLTEKAEDFGLAPRVKSASI